MTGFRGRSGRSFRAHLALSQTEEGKWRVEFDELWAKEGAKPPETRRPSTARRGVPTAKAKSASAAPPSCGRRHAAAASGGCASMAGMPITLITGPANSGKAQVVMDRRRAASGARARAAAGGAHAAPTPSTTCASSRASGVAFGVRVERFSGLIEEARRAGPAGSAGAVARSGSPRPLP